MKINGEHHTRAEDLTRAQKRQVWAHIQQADPVYAAWVQDPEVQKVLQAGFTPLIPTRLVRGALLGEG